jgi:hypothetical protein
MTRNRLVVCLLAAAAIGGIGRATAMRAETTRTVYLSAVDSKGAPISDLKAADLTVKENGTDRAVASLQPASGPMDVAIIVDDGGSGAYAAGVLQLLQALGGNADFSMRRFNPQAAKILDYGASDMAVVQAALNQIGPRGKLLGEGGQLAEAIDAAGRELLQRKSPRRAIVVLTLSGEGPQQNATSMMDELQASGAILSVVHATGANLGLVTGDGPRQSGGRVEAAGAASAVTSAMTRITDALKNQYELKYTLPDGVKPSDRVAISTSRKGVVLLAPTRIPDK